jgi:hypothetical protein
MITPEDWEREGPVTIRLLNDQLIKKYGHTIFLANENVGNEGYANGVGPYFSIPLQKMYTVDHGPKWSSPERVTWYED